MLFRYTAVCYGQSHWAWRSLCGKTYEISTVCAAGFGHGANPQQYLTPAFKYYETPTTLNIVFSP